MKIEDYVIYFVSKRVELNVYRRKMKLATPSSFDSILQELKNAENKNKFHIIRSVNDESALEDA